MPSFDTVCEADLVEVKNAVDNTAKEIGTRFDFKGTSAAIELKEKDITLIGDSDFQLQQIDDILRNKLAKRNVDVRFLDKGDVQEAKAISADLKTNLEKINHHGKRASAIVKGMLEHSRTSTGVKEPTDLNVLADEYLRLAYHGLRAKDSSFNATMETHFDPDLPKIEVIPQDIGRVLLNLINNAFYAVAERSRSTVAASLAGALSYQPNVTISTQKIDNQILIKVKDNGNGIPDAIKDKIFQPFFTTKPTGQGTGLGLSLAYDIVTKGHGGSLDVESTIGEGSEFIILLSR